MTLRYLHKHHKQGALPRILSCCLLLSIFNVSAEDKLQVTPTPIIQPNILMIVVDDLGWSDLGFSNSSGVFDTPNIDTLAKQSLRFTDAYAGAANCAPSRAVLMSGQYAPRHGVYTVSPSDRGKPQTRKLIPVKNEDFLPDETITLAESLKSAGYTTGHFGKWHLGDDPTTQGFDHNVAGYKKGHPTSYFSPYNMPTIKDGPKGEYLTQRLTTEAINWIKQVKQQPFFAYIPYYTVHTPLQPIPALEKKYRSKQGIISGKQAKYAAMVEAMDNNVGRLLAALKTNQLSDNTLVIFTSDNGGIRGISPQDPLRAGKGSYYEGGLRVPLLIYWPTKIDPRVTHVPTVNADLYPSLIALTGAKLPQQPLDGKDLTNLWLSPDKQIDKKLTERALFWHFPIYLDAKNAISNQATDPLFRTRPGSVIRKGDWKLHHYLENDSYELYNLKHDLPEHTNLAKFLPEKVAELKLDLAQWRSEIQAPTNLPLNPLYDAKIESQLTLKALLK
ncbi:sulfatase [Paraglaciecola sp. L3A3]|uniref:sulfatase n=1 Tax=Paraglaciecola sp. L3A3 TaxID=2686358 RepID=UPI001E307078|nr:sulfatase [Paraglaciecola sp. L3A3]